MTADLLAGTEFSGTTVNEVCDQFISSARFLVDDDFSAAEDGNFADGLHECVLDILGPDLFRVLLSRICSLTVRNDNWKYTVSGRSFLRLSGGVNVSICSPMLGSLLPRMDTGDVTKGML